MQLAANLTLLYADLPVAERFATAVADGFRHVEILAPYDESPQWYARELQDHGLELILVNTPVVSSEYPVGTAAQPQATELFRQAMEQAASVCTATGCRAIHVMAGKRDPRYSRDDQAAVLHDNLRWASDTFPDLILHLEALNRVDVPDYFYHLPEEVARELAAIDRKQVGMQYDFYHVVKEGLSPIDQVERHFPFIRHVQIAGAPNRHEPDLGHDGLLAGIRSLVTGGYDGYLGLEYRPAQTASHGLSWVQPLLDEGLLSRSEITK